MCTVQTPSVNLAHFGIGVQRGLAVVPSLPLLPYLQHLNISDNRLNDAVVAQFFQSVTRRGPGLLTLNVSQNPLGAATAKALQPMFASCTSLVHLDMSRCHIQDEEAKLVCQASAKAPKLR